MKTTMIYTPHPLQPRFPTSMGSQKLLVQILAVAIADPCLFFIVMSTQHQKSSGAPSYSMTMKIASYEQEKRATAIMNDGTSGQAIVSFVNTKNLGRCF